MRQFQFTVQKQGSYQEEIKKIRQWCRSRVVSKVLFQVYTELPDRKALEDVCKTLEKSIPDCICVGCSSNGNIVNGDFSGGSIAVICTVFEYPSTKVEVLHYALTEESQKDVAEQLIREVETNPWVNAVEMLLTIRGMSMTGFCDNLSKVRSDVTIFGGGAFSVDINQDSACIYSSVGGYTEKGIVFILIGGEDFYINTTYIAGWRPLGMDLKVTDSDGFILKELNHRPAYETYYRYLHISNDEHFFNNTLEFPFLYRHHGIEILRAPIASNPDGSLTMTADMEKGVTARIAYGDPWTILGAVRDGSEDIRNFGPEAIFVFSCAARRTFWGNDEIGKETLPFQEIAPTSGFYTSGEFMRTGGYVNQHNVTLAIAAMREGQEKQISEGGFEFDEDYVGKVSMINRLATFIKATTDELVEANKQLEYMAVTDGLTGLYNRKEIQRRIINAINSSRTEGVYLIMMDIDNFKHVNDTYGHDAGDKVLVGFSGMLLKMAKEKTLKIGRWGGEEFMILLTGVDKEGALELAEEVRSGFEAIDFGEVGHKTVSVGVTPAPEGEDPDTACSRVDAALYQAKTSGKNRVVYLAE